MPELPEVASLAAFLREHAVGRALARVDVVAISCLKTYDPPITALSGLSITGVGRYGKFLDLDVDGLHLVVHLSRAGWLRWKDEQPAAPPRPGKGPLAMRVHLDDSSGFDLTEAGTQKRPAVYGVRDPQEVPGIRTLAPDPLREEVGPETLAGLLDGRRTQIKGLLRDQSVLAGIGSAYSDEVLHVARMSPYKLAASLTPDEVTTLYEAIVPPLSDAVERSKGLAATALKGEKKSGLRVLGRAGEMRPVGGDVIREASCADRALQYCPTCQTGGKPLADRRMSR